MSSPSPTNDRDWLSRIPVGRDRLADGAAVATRTGDKRVPSYMPHLMKFHECPEAFFCEWDALPPDIPAVLCVIASRPS